MLAVRLCRDVSLHHGIVIGVDGIQLLPRAPTVTPVPTRHGDNRLSSGMQRCRVGFSLTTPALAGHRLRHHTSITVFAAKAQQEQEVEQSGAAPFFDNRLPVTVITGSLGSGKTTLVNHVLAAKEQGLRLAVIQNESGAVQLDGALVAAQVAGMDEIAMQDSKCLSFSVRSDLVSMVGELLDIKDKEVTDFDHILIETTGIANPSYIIQTCLLGKNVHKRIRLDGVVAIVDGEQVVGSATALETVRQIAYADRIILNKIDLMREAKREAVIRTIKRINGAAQIQKATHGAVDLDYVLSIGGFTLERIEDIVEQGTARLARDANDELHGYDSGVSTVSLTCEGNVDEDKASDWLERLLKTQADKLYRMRGRLSIQGHERALVFQGMHEIFQFCYDRPWEADEERSNKILFTGVDLEVKSLRGGLETCLVSTLGPGDLFVTGAR